MLQYHFALRQFRLIKCSFFIHSATPYIHPRFDSRIEPKLSDCNAISAKVSYADSNLEFPESTLARRMYVINIVKLMIIFNWHSGLAIGFRSPYPFPGMIETSVQAKLYENIENSRLCFRDMKIMSRRNGGDSVNNKSAGRVVYQNHRHSFVT